MDLSHIFAVASVVLAINTPAMATETNTVAYTDDDYYALSHIISAEAGNCSWDMMTYVGSVVLNRVKSEKFPDSITEVVYQAGQYTPVTSGTLYSEPTDGAIEVTDYLLENGSVLPEDVLYQANFVQGEIYTSLSTSYSTMYFCYG